MNTKPMTVKIGELLFSAVPLERERFDEKEAIHIVMELEAGGEFKVIEVGESDAMGASSINTAAQREIWQRRARAESLWVGTYLVPVETLFAGTKNPDEHRAWILQHLREQYLLPSE